MAMERLTVRDMAQQDNKANKPYIEDAVLSVREIMSGQRQSMWEAINRANRGELFVLQFISKRNIEAFPSELSAASGSSTARISALLGSLEKKGQIERKIDKSNHRNILVSITEQGRQRVKDEVNDMHVGLTKTFLEMGEEDTAEYLRLTKRFFEISQKYLPGADKPERRMESG